MLEFSARPTKGLLRSCTLRSALATVSCGIHIQDPANHSERQNHKLP
jgi:hypothetical protein